MNAPSQQQRELAIVQHLRQQLADLRAVYLFGSRVNSQAGPDSDFDIAVHCDQTLPALQRFQLGQELARLLDSEVDLIDLSSAETVLRMQVVATGKRLYARDANHQTAFEGLVFSDYTRLNEERAAILNSIQQRGNVYGR